MSTEKITDLEAKLNGYQIQIGQHIAANNNHEIIGLRQKYVDLDRELECIAGTDYVATKRNRKIAEIEQKISDIHEQRLQKVYSQRYEDAYDLKIKIYQLYNELEFYTSSKYIREKLGDDIDGYYQYMDTR